MRAAAAVIVAFYEDDSRESDDEEYTHREREAKVNKVTYGRTYVVTGAQMKEIISSRCGWIIINSGFYRLCRG